MGHGDGSPRDPQIEHHLSAVWPSGNRDHADRRLPVLLQLRRLRNTAQAEAGRLLRLLLLRDGAVSADAIWHLLRLDFVLRGRAADAAN